MFQFFILSEVEGCVYLDFGSFFVLVFWILVLLWTLPR